MSLLGSLLPGILGALNPGNIIKGIVNTATGVLDNLSKGQPLDLAGNFSRGLKTAVGDATSAIGSIGGDHELEPSTAAKLRGNQNAANVYNLERTNRVMHDLTPARERNAANVRGGVWSEDRTRYADVGNAPAHDMYALGRSVESAPAGMPDRRMELIHPGMRRVPGVDLMSARDQYGYKSIPVAMTGESTHGVLPAHDIRIAKPPKRKRKMKAKVRKGRKAR
jgi:hypothetical protein